MQNSVHCSLSDYILPLDLTKSPKNLVTTPFTIWSIYTWYRHWELKIPHSHTRKKKKIIKHLLFSHSLSVLFAHKSK